MIISSNKHLILIQTATLRQRKNMNTQELRNLRRLIRKSPRLNNSLLDKKETLRLLNRLINDLISLNKRLLRATQRTSTPTLITRITLCLTRSHKHNMNNRLGTTIKIGAISNLSRTSHTRLSRIIRQLTTILRLTHRRTRRIRITRRRLTTHILITLLLMRTRRLTHTNLIPNRLTLKHTQRISHNNHHNASHLNTLLNNRLYQFIERQRHPRSS